MLKKCICVIIGVLILCPVLLMAEIGAPDSRALIEDDLSFALSSDVVMVTNTTGDPLLETATIDFSIEFSNTPSYSEIGQIILRFTVTDPAIISVNSATAINCHEDAVAVLSEDPVGSGAYTVTIDPPAAGVPVADEVVIGPRTYIRLSASMACSEAGAVETLILSDNSQITLDDDPYEPEDINTCSACWTNGTITVSPYTSVTSLSDHVVWDGIDSTIVVEVTTTNNFLVRAIKHHIQYDTNKLKFLGLDDVIPGPLWDSYWGNPPDPEEYPIAIGLLRSQGNPFPVAADTKLYGLRFEIINGEDWDGSTTSITFQSTDTILVSQPDLGNLFCADLSCGPGFPADYDFTDAGQITLPAYTAKVHASVVSNTWFVGSTTKTVTYSFGFKNGFSVGLPNNDPAFNEAITFNLDCETGFFYKMLSLNNTNAGVSFIGDYYGSNTGQDFSIVQNYDASKDGAVPYQANYPDDAFEELLQVSFDFDPSLADPDDYTQRSINVFEFENWSDAMGDLSQAGSLQLNADGTDHLYVARFLGGSMWPSDDSLEVDMGQYYMTGGSGATITKALTARNNFGVEDFSFTGTIDEYFTVQSITTSHNYTISGDAKTFTVYGTTLAATDDDWATLATIVFNCASAPSCGSSYSGDVTFSSSYMKDAGDVLRYLDMPETITLTRNGSCPPPPSCPVLYVYNNETFIEQNPLLTACEASNYTEVVTDYYVVPGISITDDGLAKFQLRELEDEITSLESIELITVDHDPESYVACTMDGRINTFLTATAPATAVDHRGLDVLDQVYSTDRTFYQSDEPGYLIVSFPANSGKGAGFTIASAEKGECPPPNFLTKSVIDGKRVLNEVIIEVLGEDNEWLTLSDNIPLRTYHTNEVVAADLSELMATNGVTIRITWSEHYATDVINMVVPSDEIPTITNHEMDKNSFLAANGMAKSWSGDYGNPLTLKNGDMLEFSFEVGEAPAGMKRDYIIVATGKYEPDYSVYTHLTPNSYMLYDNYPNPFNPTTTIAFDLPQASEVKLEVFNLLGQSVITLIDGLQEAGHQEILWDAHNDNGSKVASGVYFYRLTTDGFTESKKMMLLK